MKKLSPLRRWRLRITAGKREKRRLQALADAERKTHHRWRRRESGRASRARVCLVPPKYFSPEPKLARRQLVEFLELLRSSVLDQGKRVTLDLRQVKRMTAAGTLLFAAELDRINKQTTDKRVRCRHPEDAVVAQVIQHVGIAEMLSHESKHPITADNVRFWKVASGTHADGERASREIDQYRGLFTDAEGKALYRALTEAMTNCVHWAYPESDPVRNWWVFSEQREGFLSVAICDLGVGIPTTLRRKKDWMQALLQFRKPAFLSRDGSLIQAAMEIGRSASGMGNRGHGLAEIRSSLDVSRGSLQIHSNRGSYAYDAASGREKCSNYAKNLSIRGTIVLWRIPLKPS